MSNEEKAREIANDAIYCYSDACDAALDMAEWKDQQFKEYLEKKLESIRDCYQKSKTEYKKDYCSTQMVVIAEIIDELFGGE